MPDNFKDEYIKELILAGYTSDEAEEQYLMELKEIKLFDLFNNNPDEEEDLY